MVCGIGVRKALAEIVLGSLTVEWALSSLQN